MDGVRVPGLPRKDGLPSEIIRCLYRDRAGTLWIGTDDGGLVREKGRDGSRSTAPATGCPLRRCSPSSRTATGTCGSEPKAAASTVSPTENSRPSRPRTASPTTPSSPSTKTRTAASGSGPTEAASIGLKNGKFTPFTRKDGLFDDVQYAILEDGRGYLWMSCSRGIFRVRRQDLEEFAEGTRDSVTSVSFGRADGMRSSECSGFTQPAGWKSRDGRLWFPTVDGAVVIDPDRIKTNMRPPPVVIEQTRIDRRLVPRTGAGRDPARPRGPRVSLHGPLVHRPRPRLLQVQARGLRQGMDRRRNAPHRLLHEHPARAGTPSASRPATTTASGTSRATRVGFRLRPHFRQTPWFYGLCAVASRPRGLRRSAPAGGPGAGAGGRAQRAGGRAHAPARGAQRQAPAALRDRLADGDRQPPPLRSHARAGVEARVPRRAAAVTDHDRHRLLQGLQRRQRPPGRRPVPAARRLTRSARL